jgi:hypothetical protein
MDKAGLRLMRHRPCVQAVRGLDRVPSPLPAHPTRFQFPVTPPPLLLAEV